MLCQCVCFCFVNGVKPFAFCASPSPKEFEAASSVFVRNFPSLFYFVFAFRYSLLAVLASPFYLCKSQFVCRTNSSANASPVFSPMCALVLSLLLRAFDCIPCLDMSKLDSRHRARAIGSNSILLNFQDPDLFIQHFDLSHFHSYSVTVGRSSTHDLACAQAPVSARAIANRSRYAVNNVQLQA